LWKQANLLKLLSDSFNIPIVVVNQVSDLFHDIPILGTFSISGGSKVIPTLGLTWSNCVNTRIMIGKTNKKIIPPPLQINDGPDMKKHKVNEVTLRKMHIILASHLPNSSCSFIVEEDGVRGIPD